MKIGRKIVEKPWGTEEWIAHNEFYVLRILNIKKGARVSLQYHEQKVESLYIDKGSAIYTFQRPGGEVEERIIKAGDILEHRPYEIHREEALEDMRIIEVSTPEIDDIIRLDDDYGRKS
ncbi:MAG: cupin [Firmicutes bacterium]|nr:cupin [Bacillota bacterium]